MRLIEPIILMSLHKDRAHGYSLMEDLKEYGLGNIDISILYRTLHQMEELGWIASKQDEKDSQGPPRRVYQITPQGENILEEYIQDLENRCQNIQRIIQDYRTHLEMKHEN
jgi:PadR family transcriptional regulator PadR